MVFIDFEQTVSAEAFHDRPINGKKINSIALFEPLEADSLRGSQRQHYGLTDASSAKKLFALSRNGTIPVERINILIQRSGVHRADAAAIRCGPHTESEILSVLPIVRIVGAAMSGACEVANLILFVARAFQSADRFLIKIRLL